MNDEEQAVLNFFSQPDNFPLGLSVAEQMDNVRERLNSDYWRELLFRMEGLIGERALPWKAELTEDRNKPDCLVGLYCAPDTDQAVYLRPMMEQQYSGGTWRIYFGLMWSATPAPDQLTSPAVAALGNSLEDAGFKNNSNFLGWQWTALHPRRKDFLLRYSGHPEGVLDESMNMLKKLLVERRDLIAQANDALRTAPRSMTISLDQLRGKRNA